MQETIDIVVCKRVLDGVETDCITLLQGTQAIEISAGSFCQAEVWAEQIKRVIAYAGHLSVTLSHE